MLVWSECRPVSRRVALKEAAAALLFHYQRVVFGSQYGM